MIQKVITTLLSTLVTKEEIYDTELKGMSVRLLASRRKVFSLRYRNKDSQRVRYTIGNYGNITVAQVRKIAQEKVGEVAPGKDP